MHIVAKTGVPEINQSHLIKGQKMVVQRIPIKKDGKVIAVFGQVLFKDVRDVGKLADKAFPPRIQGGSSTKPSCWRCVLRVTPWTALSA